LAGRAWLGSWGDCGFRYCMLIFYYNIVVLGVYIVTFTKVLTRYLS
jgi:hypothetical protein